MMTSHKKRGLFKFVYIFIVYCPVKKQARQDSRMYKKNVSAMHVNRLDLSIVMKIKYLKLGFLR